MQKKRTRINIHTSGFREFFNDIIEKENFDLSYTNYTQTIKTDNYIYFFTPSVGSKKPFYANSKIKSDIKKNNCEDFTIMDFDVKEINYYNFGNITEHLPLDRAVGFDFNAAYPRCLYESKVITKETFDYLLEMKKLERLKSIGMLATVKNSMRFENGKAIKSEIIKSEFEKYYFVLQKIIGDILHSVFLENKDIFLFYWFDGIYFKNLDFQTEKKIIKHFVSNGYPYKKEILTEMQIIGDTVFYKKDGKKKFLPLMKKEKFIFEENKREITKII